MKCFNCQSFTLLSFCDRCIKELEELSLGKRELENNFKVYSFYKYYEIKHLLHSKHHFYGYFVFNTLAQLSFAKLKDFFNPPVCINAIALDDRVENTLYSHSAILTKYLKSKTIKPIFSALQAQNQVKYSGKSLDFRQKNKRNFKLLKEIKNPVILVDDILTTGLSLLEAKSVLEKNKIRVLFALVLADAKV
ncbi:ComF family protein [Campylobacter sp. MIT 21-1685]|uniref:ComF family protein n=1 Tax=unclassified Campylobacter TaxID=2593542 RepID=UPI00224A4CF6|nr:MULTISPECIES: ComF family protein [unclassified Campylobacter]MCX2682305.1 ComF family protein [Campylobacter sp. MIT 21-1684]MCX2750585.1 ComF family protein [Campylobacter sp. MIT 21-1682]MCX2806868.1 ComF family protein [Campylobacter sp. MIT 21-1685]